MAQTQEIPPDTAAAPTTLEDVLAELVARRGEFHEQSYVPRDFVDRLKEVGIYRSSTPKMFGGEPMSPAEFLEVVEQVSAVDGSTGWVAAFGSALTYLAALPLETQAELYADGPDVVFAGGLFPVQPVTPTERGFVVDGRWKFASGCMGADVLGVGIPGDDASGGKPRSALLRPEQVEIVRDWDVAGMRASGSFDLVVKEVEVAREWTFIRGGEPTVDEPLYRYPTIGYQAQVHASVGLGVAQAALAFAQEAGSRTGVTGAPPLAARAYYRTSYAESYAALRSARAFFYEVAEEVWESVVAGDEVRPEQHARIRLSATHLASTAARIVGDLCTISGTGTIANKHPMQRLRRDAEVPQVHAFLGPSMYDAAGAVLLGQEPTVPGFM